MTVKSLAIAVTILCFICPTADAEVWTLGRAVQKAVEASNEIDAERLDASLADIDSEGARSGWYPSVSMSTGANIVSDVMEINLPFNSVRFGDYDSYDFTVGFNQLVYDGGRLKALGNASRERSRMNTNRARAVTLAVEFQSKAAFYGIVLAEKTVETSRTSIEEANKHLAVVLARRRQGLALETDVVRARLRISQAEMYLADRSAELETAKARFREILGLDPGDEITVDWNESAVSLYARFDESALRSRPEFAAFDAAVRSAEQTAETARAGLRPSIGLFGAFHYGRPGLDMPANDWMHYFTGGVLLSWNVWDRGNAGRDTRKALVAKKKAERNKNTFERHISRELTEALAAHGAAEKRRELSAQAAEYAESQLKLVSASYREGMATETDYDNAHTAYTRAMLDTSVASLAVHLSKAKIDYVLGISYGGEKK